MNKSFIYLNIPHPLRYRHHGRGLNLATVKHLFSFFLSFFFLHFCLTFLGLECAQFTEYRYYLPFSHNKLSNTVTHMGLQFVDKMYAELRHLSSILSFSLPCPLPRSHAAVLGILPYRLLNSQYSQKNKNGRFSNLKQIFFRTMHI